MFILSRIEYVVVRAVAKVIIINKMILKGEAKALSRIMSFE